MGTRDHVGPDLELDTEAGLDVDLGPDRHGWHRWAAVGGAVALTVVAAVVLTDPSDEGTAPAPTTALTSVAPPPTSVDAGTVPVPAPRGALLALVGDKLLQRSTVEATTEDLVALVRPPGDPLAASRSVVTVGHQVVALGTGMGDDGRRGAWLVDADAPRSPVYLGPADAVARSVRPGLVWLVDAGQARQVTLDGAVEAEPFAVDGTVVGATGAGLVVQRDDTVVWRLADASGTERDIGAGLALDGRFESVLWVAANGVVTVTDPNTGDNQGVGIVLSSDTTVLGGSFSPGADRVAVLATDGLHLAVVGGDETIQVTGTPAAATWTSDTVLAVAWQDGSLVLVAARGPGRPVRGFPIAPTALAFVVGSTT